MLLRFAVVIATVIPALSTTAPAATKVTFRKDGACLVDSKPFFPIGCWIYNLDPAVMADLHEHHFNTIVGNGLLPKDLPLVEKHGMMCIPMASDEFILAARQSPSLLGWYLTDEPEEHNQSPEQVHASYLALKARDPNHPIGITHDMLSGPPKYTGSCDFTMTDVYPVTKDRDWPLDAVGKYTDGPRAVHGTGWPNFTFIQTFGGPDTDGGKWAQPLPHEVRFMAFDALIHHANGILYFSYWPRAPITWASISNLNRDIERLVPWLVAPGEEMPAQSGNPAIEIRARKVDKGWLILAANTSPRPITTTLTVKGIDQRTIRMPFEAREIDINEGQWTERFDAYRVRAYLAGPEPVKTASAH
jgi:hypothetical protein